MARERTMSDADIDQWCNEVERANRAGERWPCVPAEPNPRWRPRRRPEAAQAQRRDNILAMPAPPVEPLNLADLPGDWQTATLPHREFALGTACPKGAVTLLCAMGGAGKSMLALQAAMGLACGRGLVAGWECSEPARALLVSLEDEPLEIRRRMQRISHACCITETEAALIAENFDFMHIGRPDFFRLNQAREIIPGPHLDTLKTLLAGGQYDLCVVDPVAALLAGTLEENSNQVAQKIIGMLSDILPPETALFLAAHVAKADREFSTSPRGAGAWSDAARQAWGLRPLTVKEIADLPPGTEPRDAVCLHSIKSNYTGAPAPVFLKRRTDPAAAGALQFLDFTASKADREASERARFDAALLEALAEHPVSLSELSGVTKGDSYKAGQSARNLVAEITGKRATISACKEAAQRLLTSGTLIQSTSEDGSKSLTIVNTGVM